MHDTDVALCAHLSVDYEPVADGDTVTGTWLCRDCDAEFVPSQWAEGWHEAAHELSRMAANLFIENTRLRIGLVALGIFGTGMVAGRRSK